MAKILSTMPGAETLKEPKASGPLRFQETYSISACPGAKVRRQAKVPNSRGLGPGENGVSVGMVGILRAQALRMCAARTP